MSIPVLHSYVMLLLFQTKFSAISLGKCFLFLDVGRKTSLGTVVLVLIIPWMLHSQVYCLLADKAVVYLGLPATCYSLDTVIPLTIFGK